MKTTEPKSSTSTALQRNSNAAPFFQPEESREGFFGSKQSHEPFFKAASPDGNKPKPSTIQAKLTIGAPDDAYEQEADAMADQAVQKITSGDDGSSIRRKCAQCAKDDAGKGMTPKLQTKSIFESNDEPANGQIQRKCEACSAETIQPLRIQRMGEVDEPALQAKGSVPGLQASSDLESRLNTGKGSGSPLPDDTRSSMESSFGADFSNVRVHTNNGAVQMNQELGAQAFTHGSDVYFNSGKYEPGSQEGKGLLAHELTHVVQQTGSAPLQTKQRAEEVALADKNSAVLTHFEAENDSFEQAAETAPDKVISGVQTNGQQARVQRQAGDVPVVQRQPVPSNDTVTDTDAHGVTRTHPKKGWNEGESKFEKKGWKRAITRHRITGLDEDNQPAEKKGNGDSDKKVKSESEFEATHDRDDQSRKVSDVTNEQANGAIVLIPDPLNANEMKGGVDVLFYLHGHGIGFRERKVARFKKGKGKGEKLVKKNIKGKWVMVPFHEVEGMEAGTVRDVDVDHMEEQLGNSIQASGRPMVAVLPQGAHSGANQFAKHFNSDAYIDDVFIKLPAQVPRLNGITLKAGRVIWGGHSGAGNTITGILAKAVIDKKGKDKGKLKSEAEMKKAGVPANLAEVVLFDAINSDNQLYQVTIWVKAQISKDAQALEGLPPDKHEDYLKNSMRFRGYFTPNSISKDKKSGYGVFYPNLKSSIDSKITSQIKEIKPKLSPAVAAKWRENYQVIPMGPEVGHEQIMGAGKIEEALDAVRPPSTPGASTTNPAPAAPPINQKTIQPSRSMLIQTNHAPVSIQRDTPSSSGADSDMVKWMEDWNKTDSYQTARALFNDKGRPSGNPETRYKKLCPKYKNNGINRPLQYLSTKINYNTTFFGYKTHAHIGMQSMLAAAEKTLTDMKDGSGNPKYTASSFKQRPWALTVRTTSAGGWSNHADGKAIDLDPDTNAHLTNKTHRDVITALTGLDIEKSNPGKALGLESYEGNKLASDRFQAAFNEAGITKRIEELKPGEEKLKTERDELAKRQSDLAASKKQIDKDRDLALKNKSLTVKGRKDIKDKAKADRTAIDKQITGIKAQLKAKNAELKNAHKPIQTLEAELKRFKAEQKNFDAATKALETAEGEVTSPSELVKTLSIEKESLDTAQILATEQAKQAKDLVREGKKAKAANLVDLQKELKAKNDALAKARKAFKIKLDEFDKAQTLLKKKEKALADKKHKRDAFTLRKYQREGFVNLSKDIVAAMKGAGFRWGGDWGTDTNGADHKDFMHFDMP